VCDDDGTRARADRILGRTTGNHEPSIRDRCGETDIPCCGKHLKDTIPELVRTKRVQKEIL
jgi:hypothetical protein